MGESFKLSGKPHMYRTDKDPNPDPDLVIYYIPTGELEERK